MQNKGSIAFAAAIVTFAGCSSTTTTTYRPSQKYPSEQLAMSSANVYKKNGDLHATMRPYTVMGKEYCPTVVSVGDTFTGKASWYGDDFHGKQTSSGEGYDMHGMTAAHKTLPMNTVVRVTDEHSGAQTVVRINDRGPFVESRIIDLSYAAAKELGIDRKGTAYVRLEVLGFEPGEMRTIDMARLAQGPKETVLNTFFVQIGSFERFAGALETKQKVGNYRGYNAIIKDTEYNNRRLFRVWLAGFRSEAEARDFINEGHFVGSFIIRE